MAQLSRPYQIALGALLVLALAWFTVLKPSDAAVTAEPLPGEVTASSVPGAAGLGSAVDKAQGAADASAANASASAAAQDAATGAPAAAPVPLATPAAEPAPVAGATGTTGATGPSAPAADPSAPILRDVAAGKVAVVLFFSREASDDRAVRRALLEADRHGGKVVVRAASIARVAEYTAITEGIDVTQSPTLLVIGPDNRARRIVGFTDTRSIDQMVADVGGARFVPRRFTGYRGRVENLCAVADQSLLGTALNGQDAAERLEILRADLIDVRRAARELEAPRRFFAFQRALEASVSDGVAVTEAGIKALKAGADPVAAMEAREARGAARGRRYDRLAKRAGLDACA